MATYGRIYKLFIIHIRFYLLFFFTDEVRGTKTEHSDLSILTKPKSRKTIASSDMAPDPSAGLNYGGVITQGFLGPFLLNSSCHDFEKVDKGRKNEQSTVGTYGGISKLYNVRGTKTEQ